MNRLLSIFLVFLCVSFRASAADFDTQEKVYNYFSVIIPYPAEAVWAVIRDFPHMPKWNKQFEDLQLFIVGKDTLAREMFGKDPHSGEPKRVYEKLNVLDDENYHFSYSVIPYTDENFHFSPFPKNVFGHRADAWVNPITEGAYAGQTFVEWRIQQDGELVEELPSQNSKMNRWLFQSLFQFLTQYLDTHNATKGANLEFRQRASHNEKRVANFQGAVVQSKFAEVLSRAPEVYPKLGDNQVLPRSVSGGLPWPRLGLTSGGCPSASSYEGSVEVAPVVLPDGTNLTFIGRRDYFSTSADSAKVREECKASFLAEARQLAGKNAPSSCGFCSWLSCFFNKIKSFFV